MTAKEKLQSAGQRIWEDESVRNKFLDDAGKFDVNKTVSVVKSMVTTIYDMAKDVKNGNYYIESKWKWFLMIACAAYAISPFDFLPDVVPGVGWTDDVAVLAIAFYFAGDEINKYREWKYEDAEQLNKEDFGDVIETVEFKEVVDEDDNTKAEKSPLDAAFDNLSKVNQ